MSLCLIAINDVEIIDNMIWIKISLNKLSDVFIGLRALYTKKIEKLILFTSDNNFLSFFLIIFSLIEYPIYNF